MGMLPPDNISPDTIKKVMTPLSSIVKMVIICISMAIEVTIRLDNSMDIINMIKALMLMGRYSL